MSARRIIGLGNPAGGDDAVGWVVAERLRRQGHAAHTIRDATALIDLLDGGDVVLIDAVAGLGPPGAVRVLRVDDLDALTPISTHSMSVPQAIQLASMLHRNMATLQIVGVAIDPPTGVEDALSPAVAAAVPQAAALALSLLGGPDA